MGDTSRHIGVLWGGEVPPVTAKIAAFPGKLNEAPLEAPRQKLLRLRFGEQRILKLGIHGNRLNDCLMRFTIAVDRRF